MVGLIKALFCELVAMTAPVVTLFYRKGWFLTPDDTVSPHGMYEPAMRQLYAAFPKWFADWWWLGIRNRAYGLAYLMKPNHFKEMGCYVLDVKHASTRWQGGWRRTINIDGYEERTYFIFGLFFIIVGYRLRPVYDEIVRDRANNRYTATRPINMDARPLISVRFGKEDD